MRSILNLFAKSPFAPLREHLEIVSKCVHKLPALFKALESQDFEEVIRLDNEISKLEHDADLPKHDIRNHLPKSLYLPIDKHNLLDILSLQDHIADAAEDVAVLVNLKKLEMTPLFKEDFHRFLSKNLETFDAAKKVVQELHELLESSFGGIEAEKVVEMVQEVAYKEHEVDVIQRDLLKKLFSLDDLPHTSFYLWLKIFEEIAVISNLSEKLANRIRTTLELK